MATNKYNKIEIQTAKNLMEQGYKWIARNRSGKLLAYHSKPSNRGRIWLSDDDDYGYYFCEFVPIFLNISIEDSEPTSLESIVHPHILDDAEKRYLKGVIRPFRDRVQYIAKAFADDACVYRINCYIFIHFNDGSDDMDFPVFHESKMYKGMKSDKAYTLEELGL